MIKEWGCKLTHASVIAGSDWKEAIDIVIAWVAYRKDNFTVQDVLEYFTGIPEWRIQEQMELNGWPIRHAAA